MKRFVVLFVLVVLAALPLMADPGVVTGDLYVGFTAGGSPLTTAYMGEMDLFVNAKVDDFTKFYVELENYTNATPNDTVVKNIGAYLQTDLGAFMKIDPKMLGWTILGGYYSAGDQSYVSQTAYGTEDVSLTSVGTYWFVQTELKVMDFVGVRLGLNPLTAPVFGDYIAGVWISPKLGSIGTLNFDVFADGNAINNGVSGADTLIVDGRFDLTAVKDLTVGIGGSFAYGLMSNKFDYGASVKATYGTLGNVAVGMEGDQAAFNWIVASTAITPVPLVTIDGALKLNMATSAPSVFDSADVALQLNVGKSNVYVGYLIANGKGVAPTVIWAPNANGTNGGFYVKFYTAF